MEKSSPVVSLLQENFTKKSQKRKPRQRAKHYIACKQAAIVAKLDVAFSLAKCALFQERTWPECYKHSSPLPCVFFPVLEDILTEFNTEFDGRLYTKKHKAAARKMVETKAKALASFYHLEQETRGYCVNYTLTPWPSTPSINMVKALFAGVVA